MTSPRPTNRTYTSLEAAYDHFNQELFDGQLPACLITVQRHAKALGYYSQSRFISTVDPGDITDEIALNPQYFADRTPEQVLSTLAREMVTLWQQHFGKSKRHRYHDRQWAAKMRDIGLVPSATGEPGGKETGQKMSHYIEEGGRFAVACVAFLAANTAALYHDRAGDDEASRIAREKRAACKTKFTCPDCGANAWGKSDLHLMCGTCQTDMATKVPGNKNAPTILQAEFGQAVIEQGRKPRTPDIAIQPDLPQSFTAGLALVLG